MSGGDGPGDVRGPEVVLVGRVLRAHGVRGNVIVDALSDRPERFEPGSELMVGTDRSSLTVGSVQPYKGKLLVGFDEIKDRGAADALRRADLVIATENVGELGEGEVWTYELIGRDVVDADGASIGRVTGIEENPAHDLLVVEDTAGNEILVPMVAEFMDPLERASDLVRIHPPPGLLPGDDDDEMLDQSRSAIPEVPGDRDV